MDNVRDDEQQPWENEYEQWCAEQDERAVATLNALLRAIGDGTVYDMRNEDADKR